MNTIALFVLAIKLSIVDGTQLAQPLAVSGPYDSVEACSAQQIETGIQRPVNDGTITVYMCGVLPPGDQPT